LHRQSIARATGILVPDANNRNGKAYPLDPWTMRTQFAKRGVCGSVPAHLSKMVNFGLRSWNLTSSRGRAILPRIRGGGWEISEYEQNAAECRQKAAQTTDPQLKKQLKEMAEVCA
jgi:hypothetical protein